MASDEDGFRHVNSLHARSKEARRACRREHQRDSTTAGGSSSRRAEDESGAGADGGPPLRLVPGGCWSVVGSAVATGAWATGQGGSRGRQHPFRNSRLNRLAGPPCFAWRRLLIRL